MSTRQVLLAIATLALLAGCQTPYQEIGFEGGVTAMPIAQDTYRIVARGNGFTDPVIVQDYALLKAAEVTLQSGNSHFVVLSGADATQVSVGQTPGTVQTNIIGRTAFSTYTPGVTYDIVKPGQDLLIRVGNIPTGISAPPNAFVAQQVFDAISPRVQRPKKS